VLCVAGFARRSAEGGCIPEGNDKNLINYFAIIIQFSRAKRTTRKKRFG
jgi:hypothetical protein